MKADLSKLTNLVIRMKDGSEQRFSVTADMYETTRAGGKTITCARLTVSQQ